MRDLVRFMQFKKRKNTHGELLLLVKLQAATLIKVTLPHGCFSRFLNCTNSTKSRKASHRKHNFELIVRQETCDSCLALKQSIVILTKGMKFKVTAGILC